MAGSTEQQASSAYAPAEAAQLLAGSLAALRATIEALPPPLLTWRPAPGEWCALEVIGHLSEAEERGFASRIRDILDEDRPRFAGWDPDAVALARRDHERDPAGLLAELAERRLASIALVETLSEDDLDRGGDHPDVGFITIRDLLHEWVHHDANHLRQILANIQAYTWPHMGNAQRFSGDG